MVTIYVASVCIRNPGPGAYCALLIFPDGAQHQLINGISYTDENQLALLAALRALWDFREQADIEVRTCNEYLLRGVGQRRGQSQRRGPRTAFGEENLWEHLAEKSCGRNVIWTLLRDAGGDPNYQRALYLSQQAAGAQAAKLELAREATEGSGSAVALPDPPQGVSA